jgi:hypothetical protein
MSLSRFRRHASCAVCRVYRVHRMHRVHYACRTPSSRLVAMAQADQAAHGLAARAPDMGVVRHTVYPSTLARPSDQGDQLASELHATLYKVCGTYTAHDLAFRFGGRSDSAMRSAA